MASSGWVSLYVHRAHARAHVRRESLAVYAYVEKAMGDATPETETEAEAGKAEGDTK